MTESKNHLKNEDLQAYLDKRMAEDQANLIRAHLETCPACREEFSLLETLAARLESLPDSRLSRDLAPGILTQLKQERSYSPAITWTILAEAVAAGAAIGALIPVLQAAGWLPSLQESQLLLKTAVNLQLARMISGWLLWWNGVKLQVSQQLASFDPLAGLPMNGFSPWLVIGGAGLLIIIINALVLKRTPLPRRNHHQV